ncbi:MAG: hypothetical protein K8R02_04985 [Anaerohalosphaeraceae bacterium]|nr:hypothetical protein [Anaerohalosphaeraceae bacterium]
MRRDKKLLSGLLVCLFVFAGCARAEVRVFLEQDALRGAVETADKIGDVRLFEIAPVAGYGEGQIIVAGRLSNEAIALLVQESGLKFDTKWIGEQGFYVKSLENGIILITANTHTGILYGLMELRDRIHEDDQKVLEQKFDVKDRPIFEVRKGEISRRANFTTYYAGHEGDHPLFLYEDSPEVFPSEKFREKYIRKVQANREVLKKRVADSAAYGAKTYLFIYAPSMPPDMHEPFISAHPEVKPVRQTKEWHPFMCPSQKASKDILYMKFRNLFRDIPNIGGVLLCFNEGWPSIFSCGCQKCQGQPFEERLVEYIMLVRKAVQESSPNTNIYLRPWQIINHGMGGDRNKFIALADKLPEDVRFWSKVTVPPGSDYLWRDYFSPYIKMPRMETFGWHIYHPNLNQPCIAQLCYTAPKLRDRAIKLAKLGLKGQPSCDGPVADEVLYEPSRLAALKIAWDPFRFDPNEFLLKWAAKKFGEEAAPYVAEALKDTHKITDAFIILPRNTNWFQMLNFVKGKKTHCYSRGMAAEQTEGVANVDEKTLAKVLSPFKIREAVKVAENAEKNLAKALAIRPDDIDLKRFWMMSKATAALAKFYRDYHFALVYNNMSRTTTGENSSEYHKSAAWYITAALPEMEAYVEWMSKVHPEFNRYFDKIETSWMGTTYPKFVPYIFGQVATVNQQCRNGYHRVVMEPLRAEKYPYLLCEVQNHQKKIGYKRYAPWPDEMKWKNIYPKLMSQWKGEEFVVDLDISADTPRGLPAVISSSILPKLQVKFRGDLSKGGMLVMRYVPLGGKARSGAKSEEAMRKSILKIMLDGKAITTLVDLATDNTMEDNEYIRYVELGPSTFETENNKGQHELTFISMPECTGTELYTMRVYTPTHQSLYLQNPDAASPYDGKVATEPRLWSYEY